jgi:uncharacterized protein YciI
MFIVLLRFSTHRDKAAALMEAHKAWIQTGFDDGHFLMTGSLMPQAGGAILAQGLSHTELEARLAADPFVREGVVSAEIIEIAPSRVAPGLEALLT